MNSVKFVMIILLLLSSVSFADESQRTDADRYHDSYARANAYYDNVQRVGTVQERMALTAQMFEQECPYGVNTSYRCQVLAVAWQDLLREAQTGR